ncbi:MAG: class I SAM-dependent methyltransferase [Aphanocapsa feldmannii 277cV]|uniref:Class I SAM-dependent methyltransferase n=2 Tax=Aphanocapsa feldmannii TaxID=192050 RepID=A0A524RLP4_9CHRO|nr:MAG: class I SAM-dependent methyltransferase [Aphanocapsa feldmannii 288cV]TGG90999.1 MAG: class I SAM-dependent methyltransferase [Aphanocapsa feldmannii 277cV]TGH24339.1 MAG: class I SAM-dependent methyltransferase [Aphanocapsa feldmannii 277cI]
MRVPADLPPSSMAAADQATPAVSTFYDCFPYPPDPLQDGPPPGYNWRWCHAAAYSHCTGTEPPQRDQLRILDAGCGTGVSTDYLVHLNPGARVTALDISEGSLTVARERLRRSAGASAVAFHRLSLLKAHSLGRFHHINSVGVIHHMADPSAGLQALAEALEEGGILHIFVYADGGRWEIHRAQRALRLLGAGSDAAGVGLGRELIAQLPEHNSIRRRHEQRWVLDTHADPSFADMYLHPQETSYNLARLFALVDGCGLHFVGFSDRRRWALESLLRGETLARARALPWRQQLELVEALDSDISHFEFFLSKGPLPRTDWSDGDVLLRATARRNPCLWGWPSQTLMDQNMEPLTLSDAQFAMAQALDAQGSSARVAALGTGDQPGETARIARELWQLGVFLLRPENP